MSAASYHGGEEFARGYEAAQAGDAWWSQGGHWTVTDVDEIGAHVRAATASEACGIRQFYSQYAPGLRIAGEVEA